MFSSALMVQKNPRKSSAKYKQSPTFATLLEVHIISQQVITLFLPVLIIGRLVGDHFVLFQFGIQFFLPLFWNSDGRVSIILRIRRFDTAYRQIYIFFSLTFFLNYLVLLFIYHLALTNFVGGATQIVSWPPIPCVTTCVRVSILWFISLFLYTTCLSSHCHSQPLTTTVVSRQFEMT